MLLAILIVLLILALGGGIAVHGLWILAALLLVAVLVSASRTKRL